MTDSKRRKRETGTIQSQTVSKTLKVRNKQFNSNDAGKFLCFNVYSKDISMTFFN